MSQFVKQFLYFAKELNEMQYQTPLIFGECADKENMVLNLNVNGKEIRFFLHRYYPTFIF